MRFDFSSQNHSVEESHLIIGEDFVSDEDILMTSTDTVTKVTLIELKGTITCKGYLKIHLSGHTILIISGIVIATGITIESDEIYLTSTSEIASNVLIQLKSRIAHLQSKELLTKSLDTTEVLDLKLLGTIKCGQIKIGENRVTNRGVLLFTECTKLSHLLQSNDGKIFIWNPDSVASTALDHLSVRGILVFLSYWKLQCPKLEILQDSAIVAKSGLVIECDNSLINDGVILVEGAEFSLIGKGVLINHGNIFAATTFVASIRSLYQEIGCSSKYSDPIRSSIQSMGHMSIHCQDTMSNKDGRIFSAGVLTVKGLKIDNVNGQIDSALMLIMNATINYYSSGSITAPRGMITVGSTESSASQNNDYNSFVSTPSSSYTFVYNLQIMCLTGHMDFKGNNTQLSVFPYKDYCHLMPGRPYTEYSFTTYCQQLPNGLWGTNPELWNTKSGLYISCKSNIIRSGKDDVKGGSCKYYSDGSVTLNDTVIEAAKFPHTDISINVLKRLFVNSTDTTSVGQVNLSVGGIYNIVNTTITTSNNIVAHMKGQGQVQSMDFKSDKLSWTADAKMMLNDVKFLNESSCDLRVDGQLTSSKASFNSPVTSITTTEDIRGQYQQFLGNTVNIHSDGDVTLDHIRNESTLKLKAKMSTVSNPTGDGKILFDTESFTLNNVHQSFVGGRALQKATFQGNNDIPYLSVKAPIIHKNDKITSNSVHLECDNFVDSNDSTLDSKDFVLHIKNKDQPINGTYRSKTARVYMQNADLESLLDHIIAEDTALKVNDDIILTKDMVIRTNLHLLCAKFDVQRKLTSSQKVNVFASDNISVTGTIYQHQGISLTSDKSVKLDGGRISGQGDVFIKGYDVSINGVNNGNGQSKSINGKGGCIYADKGGFKSDSAYIEATGNLSISSKGTFVATTSKLTSGDKMRLHATGEMIISSAKESIHKDSKLIEGIRRMNIKAGTTLDISSDSNIAFQAIHTQSNQGTTIYAKGEIKDVATTCQTSRGVTQIASTHNSDSKFTSIAGGLNYAEGVQVKAKDNIYYEGQDVKFVAINKVSIEKWAIGSKSYESIEKNATGATLESEHVHLKAKGVVDVQAVNFQSKNTILEAPTLKLRQAVNQSESHYKDSWSSACWKYDEVKDTATQQHVSCQFAGAVQIKTDKVMREQVAGETLSFMKELEKQVKTIDVVTLENFVRENRQVVEGPSEAVSMVVCLAVAAATAGAGAALGALATTGMEGAISAVLSNMTAAGFQSLCSECANQLLNHKLDPIEAAKHVSLENVFKRTIATGLSSGVMEVLKLPNHPISLEDNLAVSAVTNGTSFLEAYASNKNPDVLDFVKQTGNSALGNFLSHHLNTSTHIDPVPSVVLNAAIGGATGFLSNFSGHGALSGAAGAGVTKVLYSDDIKLDDKIKKGVVDGFGPTLNMNSKAYKMGSTQVKDHLKCDKPKQTSENTSEK